MISQVTESAPAPEQTHLSIGEQLRCGEPVRVITPTGRQGVIIPPKFEMPQHHLIQFDDGTVFWMLKEILQPAIEKPSAKKRRKAA